MMANMETGPSPNAGGDAGLNLVDGQEDAGTYKNLMAVDQNGKLDTTPGPARQDASGAKAESRGSRRSVVFSKIKNPGQGPPAGGSTLNGSQASQSKHQMKVAGSEKQASGAGASTTGSQKQAQYMQQVNNDAVNQLNQQYAQPGRQIKLIQ